MKVELITKYFDGRQLADGKNWVVKSPVIFLLDGIRYAVPRGFMTDLTTLIGEGKHTICAVIHDYLYYLGILSRRMSDYVLRKCCAIRGTIACRRGWIWGGVRVGAWGAWRKHRKNGHCFKSLPELVGKGLSILDEHGSYDGKEN